MGAAQRREENSAAQKNISRVRKLLRRAHNPLGQEDHEAARASERARALMEEYGLSEDDVSDDAHEVSTEVVDTATNPHRWELAKVVGIGTRCIVMRGPKGTAFRGIRRDVRQAGEVYQHLCHEADQRACQPLEVPSWSSPNAWKSLFWLGFVGAIRGRFSQAQTVETPTEDDAPAVAPTDERVIPDNVVEAAEALKRVAREIGGDSTVLINRLRERAYATGYDFGSRVSFGAQANLLNGVK